MGKINAWLTWCTWSFSIIEEKKMESSTRKGLLIKPPLMTTMGEGAKSGEDYCCLIMNNSLNYLRHTNRSYPFNWHPKWNNDTLLQSEHPIRISTTLSCCSSPLHGVLAINLLIPSLNTHPPHLRFSFGLSLSAYHRLLFIDPFDQPLPK